MKHRGQKARQTAAVLMQKGVRPLAHIERLAEGLNYPKQWLSERQELASLLAASRAAGDNAHFGEERRYGAWCAAAAILAPSLPLRGWPADEPLHFLERRGRHVRRWQDGHQPLIRRIAPETARRFNRLATVAPVQLWISDPVAEARRRADQAAADARKESSTSLESLTASVAAVAASVSRALPPMRVARLRGTDDPRGEVLEGLWRLLHDPDADRLKRCRQCGVWFVDTSKKIGQLYCERACVDQAWSRARRAARRAAGPRKRRRMNRASRRFREVVARAIGKERQIVAATVPAPAPPGRKPKRARR